MKKILFLLFTACMMSSAVNAQNLSIQEEGRKIIADAYNEAGPVTDGPVTVNGAKVVGEDVEFYMYVDEDELPMSMVKISGEEIRKKLADEMINVLSSENLAMLETNLLFKYIGTTTNEVCTFKITADDLREAEARAAANVE